MKDRAFCLLWWRSRKNVWKNCFVAYYPFLSFFFQIFQALEHPLEVATMGEVQTLVLMERENFVRFIFNGSWNSVIHRDNIDQKLLEYEQTVAVAAGEGIDLGSKQPVYQWSYIQAVFFTSTILTTIGTFVRTSVGSTKEGAVSSFATCWFCRDCDTQLTVKLSLIHISEPTRPY